MAIALNLPSEFDLILPVEEPKNLDALRAKVILDENESILKNLHLYEKRNSMRNKNVRIGQHDYQILKKIGDGAEGLVFTAKDKNGTIVIVKAVLETEDSKEIYENEIYALGKLDRLLDSDAKYFVLVETKVTGDPFDEVLLDYAKDHVQKNELPSDHIPIHLKEKYFKILWEFRNATQMAHNDYRPYNIIGDTVIDFGRTEPLSRNPRKRNKQIRKDDQAAHDEWNWFYLYTDWDTIEKNPFLPNAVKRLKEILEVYYERYDDVKRKKKYGAAYLAVLEKIIATNDTSLKYPSSHDFTND